jgi:dTDP-glucose 4,6-dehydratase
MATCIVTGGAGFLGSHMSDYLLERGHRVICVDNLDTGSLQNIEHIRSEAFEFVQHDLTEPLFVDRRVDFVYHLASPASPIDYLRLPLHTLKVGSYGTHHALGLAKRHRARFLLASTSEVYGDPQVHPQPESYWGHVNPIGPRGVYDEAKRYAEALTMAYHRQQGVDTAIVRIFNTYGPRMRPHDGRAIPTFLRQALQDRPITVFGDGGQTRSFCYVSDEVDGILRLAESGARGRRSCTRRCRPTTRRSASLTSRLRGSSWAGSLASSFARVYGAPSTSPASKPSRAPASPRGL